MSELAIQLHPDFLKAQRVYDLAEYEPKGQVNLREQLRQDYTLADLLAEIVDTESVELRDKLFTELGKWFCRRAEEVEKDPVKKFRFCLDISEFLESTMPDKEYERYKNSLIERAIHEGWEIAKR